MCAHLIGMGTAWVECLGGAVHDSGLKKVDTLYLFSFFLVKCKPVCIYNAWYDFAWD